MFVLKSLVFILIGLSLRGVLQRLGGGSDAIAILPGIAAIVAAVVVARFAWIMPVAYLERALVPARRRRDPHLPVGLPLVISWAGMCGMVSLAAALALPEDFPGRDFILASAFAVILVTVLVQGTTLAPLIRAVCRNASVLHDVATLSESEARAKIAGARLDEHFDTVLSAVAAGRIELTRLHRLGEIHDSVLRALEHELDLEEVGARLLPSR